MNKFLLIMMMTTSGYAILPPAWQGVSELKTILSEKELENYLDSGDVIEGITKTAHGWVIVTNHSMIFAEIIPQSQSMPGPARFDIHFKKISHNQ